MDEPDTPTASCCCKQDRVHRALRATHWIVPGGILALMPKCPACFAAYVAMGTGLGISLSVAAQLRVAAIALCMGWLFCVLYRGIRRLSGQPGLGRRPECAAPITQLRSWPLQRRPPE